MKCKISVLFAFYKENDHALAREGDIIECPLIHLFHDALDIILTSQNDVRGIPSDDNDSEMSILTKKGR